MLDRLAAFAVTDRPEPGTFEAIFAALDASSAAVVGQMRACPLVVPIHDDAGEIAGGLWGSTLFGWLNVMMLFVPAPLRGQGVGTRVMRTAEAEARSRQCLGIFVDTFSFQAVPFYQGLGFSIFGELPDFPPGHRRVYLSKRLSAPTVSAARADIFASQAGCASVPRFPTPGGAAA